MKSVILLAFLAMAVAEPIHYSLGTYKYEAQGKPSYSMGAYEQFDWVKYNDYLLPEYITYQILEARQFEFTTQAFAAYLSKHGYPQSIVQYFVDQYEFLHKQPFGMKPYHIFQYYFEQAVPEEVKVFVMGHFQQAYKYYYELNTVEEYQQEYKNIPKPIINFAMVHGIYYSKHSLTYPMAQYGFEQLYKSHEYIMAAMQALEKNVIPTEFYNFMTQYLEQGLSHFETIQKLFKNFQAYKSHYVPYYFAQYALYEISETYHYFQTVYQYVQKQQIAGVWPQSAFFIYQQIELAYKAAEKALNVFKASEYGQFSSTYYAYQNAYEGKYTPNYESKFYPAFLSFQGPYKNMPYSYGYHVSQNDFYKPYQYGYNGPYQFGYSGVSENWESYKPYQYGPYQYSGAYKGWESFKPYQYGFYGQKMYPFEQLYSAA